MRTQRPSALAAAVGVLVLAGCAAPGSASAGSSSSGSSSSGSSSGQGAGGITVLAAASLTDVFTTIAQQVESEHDVEVTLSFAASSELVAQV